MVIENNLENDLFARIDYGVKRGVARALVEHKKAGRCIVISQNGKIIKIPPEKIEIPEEFKYLLTE